jgi:hypothetical protein
VEKEQEEVPDLTVDKVRKRIDDFCDVGRDNVVLNLESQSRHSKTTFDICAFLCKNIPLHKSYRNEALILLSMNSG